MEYLEDTAREIFLQTLRSVDVRLSVRKCFSDEAVTCGNTLRRLDRYGAAVIIAMGKAAAPMAEAAVGALRAARQGPKRLKIIVVAPRPPELTGEDFTFFQGAHPTPDTVSAVAARAILEELGRVASDTLVLFLVSGGASSMVELPLHAGISMAELAQFYQCLVASGLAITEMNVLRKRVSAVKGGRLALAAAKADQCTLIVSDVPAAASDLVGSGPSVPDSNNSAQCRALYAALPGRTALPLSLRSLFETEALPETPGPLHPAFAGAAWSTILSMEDLAATAASIATAAGFVVEVDCSCDDWDCAAASRYLLERSATLAQRGPRTCLISAGEVTVQLGEAHGVGGRNQHFALLAAIAISGRQQSCAVLSAGSDGVDGNSPAAGAVAGTETCKRARRLGMDPDSILKEFDSFSMFDRLGDSIVTGPTGNNLRDLRLILTSR